MNKYTIGGKRIEDLNQDLLGSDRSCAVLAGAILDDLLKSLLEKYLLPTPKKGNDKLLGRSAPLDSFAARIEIARRLNLICEETQKALDWIRDIRNLAAHCSDFEFKNNSNKDKVANIVTLLKLQDRMPNLLQKPYDGVKGNFVAATLILVAFLEIEIGEIIRTTCKPVIVLDNIVICEG